MHVARHTHTALRLTRANELHLITFLVEPPLPVACSYISRRVSACCLVPARTGAKDVPREKQSHAA